MSKQHYTLGFMFSESRLMVALIQKDRPAWQAGKLNGIGGKVEPGEEPLAAQRREFREETGVDHEEWDCFGELEGPEFKITLFRAFTPKVQKVYTMESEKVHLLGVTKALRMLIESPSLFLNNIQWLLPLALDESRPGCPMVTKVLY